MGSFCLPVEHRSYNRVFKITSTILKPSPPPTPKTQQQYGVAVMGTGAGWVGEGVSYIYFKKHELQQETRAVGAHLH